MRFVALCAVLLTVAAAVSCSGKCKKTFKAESECSSRPGCKLEDCDLSKKKRGKKCIPIKCPEQCKAGRKANRECKPYHPHCVTEPCTYIRKDKKVRAGRVCTKALVAPAPPSPTVSATPSISASVTPSPAPALTDCPDECTTFSKARHDCETPGLRGKCGVRDCSKGSFVFACTSISPSPSPLPGVTPKNCPFCPTRLYLSAEDCHCVDHPCKACPKNTICRLVERDRSERHLGKFKHICATCDCGYCDRDGIACCHADGDRCGPSGKAELGQCVASNFAIKKSLGSSSRNVCFGENDVLLQSVGQNLLDVCACEPSHSKVCTIERDNTRTNCLVPKKA